MDPSVWRSLSTKINKHQNFECLMLAEIGGSSPICFKKFRWLFRAKAPRADESLDHRGRLEHWVKDKQILFAGLLSLETHDRQ